MPDLAYTLQVDRGTADGVGDLLVHSVVPRFLTDLTGMMVSDPTVMVMFRSVSLAIDDMLALGL